MIRQIVIVLAAIAAILAYAPKVSHEFPNNAVIDAPQGAAAQRMD
jgi:hypothetical protein